MDSGGPEELADGLPGWFPRALRIVSIRAVWVLIVASIGTLVILYLTRRLSDFFAIILTALFLSFAIEPAVNWFAGRGMRRGAATGLMFVFILIVVAILLMLIVPAIVSGFRQLVANADTWVATITRWLDRLGITVDQARLSEQIRTRADDIVGYATNFAGHVFGIATSILGGLFRWATIALFTFYLVAQGPQLRRAICRALPPEYQQRVLFVWTRLSTRQAATSTRACCSPPSTGPACTSRSASSVSRSPHHSRSSRAWWPSSSPSWGRTSRAQRPSAWPSSSRLVLGSAR
jgi:predicted PurR-regulated permease PerM